MSGPSDRRFDLNLVEEAAPPSRDNIWRPSFVSPTGHLTVGDSVMKNDMTAAVVARNLLTPKDNRLLSKRSDELAVKDSLALSVQCAGSVSNMAQRLFARTRQVESLAAEVMSLKQEIRGLKHENKQLHRLAHDYATTFTYIRENTPNKIACSKIEEAPPSESREPDSQHDYFLKNRRDTALRISRARPSSRIAFSKIEEASFSESREPDPR
ncbi:hypothetical protein C1H46_024564 [Malus baccata]|uniref:Uncharacterized protein n=1 Tax=Malus baccata TaxID=106549 RepID=A0A540LUA1_MALBA|nr:hypothetical protein C1H46_024564 [Malus baccata]